MIAVLGLAVASVACGSSTTSRTTTSQTTTPATATTMSVAQLDALRLDAADIGAGWQVGAPINDADRAEYIQVPCPGSALNPTILKRLAGVTGVQFEPVDGSHRHIMEMFVTGVPAQLGADLQAWFDAIQSCSSAQTTTPGTGTISIQKLAIPALGDQRAAFVFTALESSDQIWHIRSAVVRVGSVAVSFGLTEILTKPGEQPTISDATFVQLLQKAVAMLTG
jgi:hypothetical protein